MTFEKEIAALEKVIKVLKLAKKTETTKKPKKITRSIKKPDLKKCTKEQYIEYIKKNDVDYHFKNLKNVSKEKLFDLVWEDLNYETDSDTSDSDSDSDTSDSDSDTSDSDEE